MSARIYKAALTGPVMRVARISAKFAVDIRLARIPLCEERE